MSSNVLPTLWGPHIWYTIHLITIGYPERPTKAEKITYADFLNRIPEVLPCESCRDSARAIPGMFPVPDMYLKNRESLMRWGFILHNKVNRKLGKPVMQWDTFIALYNIFVDL